MFDLELLDWGSSWACQRLKLKPGYPDSEAEAAQAKGTLQTCYCPTV